MTTPAGGPIGGGVGGGPAGGIALGAGVGAGVGAGRPRAGAAVAENASLSFLMVGGLMAALYLAVLMLIRKVSGRGPEVENDGILGI